MTKTELLMLVQSLPDDLEAIPLDISESSVVAGDWESQSRSGAYGGVHQRSVDNTLTLRLLFRTRYEGEFRRTYENPDGQFFNVRRIN